MAKKSRSKSGTPSKVETITLESDTDDVAAATTANGQHSEGDGDDDVKLVDGSDAGSPSAVKAHDEAEYKPDSPKQKRVAAPVRSLLRLVPGRRDRWPRSPRACPPAG